MGKQLGHAGTDERERNGEREGDRERERERKRERERERDGERERGGEIANLVPDVLCFAVICETEIRRPTFAISYGRSERRPMWMFPYMNSCICTAVLSFLLINFK